jgi:hypothetical protein
MNLNTTISLQQKGSKKHKNYQKRIEGKYKVPMKKLPIAKKGETQRSY